MKYNHLNLPTEITFGTGDFISYKYNAAGQKISKFVSSVNANNTVKNVEYLDGFQYTGEELNFFPHAEGYVNVVLGTTGNRIFNYVYNYTDHLGNIRLSYTKDLVNNQLKIMEENHYYPFGLKHQKYTAGVSIGIKAIDENTARPASMTSTPYNYKYNGQEWQDELGLNMYDMDMRQYDPAIARWVVLDPVIHHSMSPYNSFDNNPVFWADPSGADSGIFPDSMANFGEHVMTGNNESKAKYKGRNGDGDYYNKEGKHIGNDGKNDGKIYISDGDKNNFLTANKNEAPGGLSALSAIRIGLSMTNSPSSHMFGSDTTGGFHEVRFDMNSEGNTIFTTGAKVRVENGEAVGQINFYDLFYVDTTKSVIVAHSHPTGTIIEKNGLSYTFSALEPTQADLNAFKKYSTNIIMGNLEKNPVIQNSDGSFTPPKNIQGAVFYNSSGEEIFKITSKAINNILSHQNK